MMRHVLVLMAAALVACTSETEERWAEEKPIWDAARADFAAGRLSGRPPEKVPAAYDEREELQAFVLPSGIEARFDAGEPPLAAFLWHRSRNEVWIVHDPSGRLGDTEGLGRVDGAMDISTRPDLQRVRRLLGRPIFRTEDKGDGYHWVIVR